MRENLNCCCFGASFVVAVAVPRVSDLQCLQYFYSVSFFLICIYFNLRHSIYTLLLARTHKHCALPHTNSKAELMQLQK